jgi:hypothetical protein
VNGAGTLFTLKLGVIPNVGGDTSSITFGFPAIVPVTLTVKKTVPPGEVVLDAGATFKPHAACASGRPFTIITEKNTTTMSKAALTTFKKNHECRPCSHYYNYLRSNGGYWQNMPRPSEF